MDKLEIEDDLDVAEEFSIQEATHVHTTTQVAPTHQKTVSTSYKSTQHKNKHQNSSRYKFQQSQEDKQCTFKPRINEYKNRNLNEFLEFQKGFVEKKEWKLALIKQQINERESKEFTGKPSIDSNSKRLASKCQEPVFQRLATKTNQDEQIDTQEGSFQPQILEKSKSLSRNDPVAELLYSDAQRRIEKEKITARESAKKRDVVPHVNNNTTKLVLKAIRHEFEQFTSDNETLAPIVALTILSQLFNVDLNPKKDCHTEALCDKIVKILCGSISPSSLTRSNRLWRFIQVILGKEQDGQQEFSRQQQSQIYKSFSNFYRSRMTKPPKQVQQDAPTFQPEILKNSSRLALKKREKMLNQANTLLTQQNIKLTVEDSKDLALADLYMLERLHKQQQYEQNKVQKQISQLKQCTFKPEINKSIPESVKSQSRQSFCKKINQSGASSSKQFRMKTNENNTMNTQYSEKDKSLSKQKGSLSKENRPPEIKDIQKTVLRLSAARRDRQFNNMIKDRGYPKGVDNWESYRQKNKKEVQKVHRELKGYEKDKKKGFVFDVHVGNGVIETIEVGKGQDLTKLIEQVAAKYGFDNSKKSKLMQMMSYHLRLHDKENINKTQSDN